MRRLLVMVAAAMVALAAPVRAADLSHLYDDATLAHWQERYGEAIRWNFETLVLGSLLPQERQALGPVRLDMPLRAEAAVQGSPLAFYAGGDTVTLPVFSIKFFDDLTLAWAVLWSGGHDLALIGDYLSVLKYREPVDFGGRFPDPLTALDVPPDIWKTDAAVDHVAQNALKSALVWIMAHELGHLYHRHGGYDGVSPADARAAEAEADAFANEIMRRIGVAPLGMAQFFTALVHLEPNRWDFPDPADFDAWQAREQTHPLTAERLQAIAADLTERPEDFARAEPDAAAATASLQAVSGELARLAGFLGDPDIHRIVKARAMAADLEGLRHGKRATVEPDATAALAFDGLYDGVFTHPTVDGPEDLPATMELRRRGDRVAGRFDFGGGPARLEGLVVDDVLEFRWTWGLVEGSGRLRAQENGEALAGDWTMAGEEGIGRWDLRRRRH